MVALPVVSQREGEKQKPLVLVPQIAVLFEFEQGGVETAGAQIRIRLAFAVEKILTLRLVTYGRETPIMLNRTTPDGRARAAALAAVEAVACQPAPVVAYESVGTLAVIGPEAEALSAADSLGDAVDCTLVVTEPTDHGRSTGDKAKGGKLIYASVARIHGYLGRFEVVLASPNGPVELGAVAAGRRWVDLVLDLMTPGFISGELPSVGYYAPACDPTELAQAMAEIPELVGCFERPKFFDYDPGFCAHGRSGIRACTRCPCTLR